VAAGATHAFDEHLTLMFLLQGSPPTRGFLPLCIEGRLGPLCVVASEELWSGGAAGLLSYDSAGERAFEWGVDAGYSPTVYGLEYQLQSGRLSGESASLSLWQHRVGLGLVTHLFRVVDPDLRGAYYAFSGAETTFLQRGLTQLTGGLPIAPRHWEIAFAVTAFFLDRRLSAKLGALYAPYADPCLGRSAQLQLRITGRPGPVRIWGSVLLQGDWPADTAAARARCEEVGLAPVRSVSSYASLGAEYLF
jgi:hypothetical protein